ADEIGISVDHVLGHLDRIAPVAELRLDFRAEGLDVVVANLSHGHAVKRTTPSRVSLRRRPSCSRCFRWDHASPVANHFWIKGKLSQGAVKSQLMRAATPYALLETPRTPKSASCSRSS